MAPFYASGGQRYVTICHICWLYDGEKKIENNFGIGVAQ
jgi:hypothetical protein